MATLTVPLCLEMLTFGHPESSGALQTFRVRGDRTDSELAPEIDFYCVTVKEFLHFSVDRVI